ncbi:MAG TPA: LysM peptidoglycan-binding domain-containing protein, partial [Mobilitalea sp.]|nr:LysM peptidoglycan-binding domain-containing protein [Mobilitalea sp.]
TILPGMQMHPSFPEVPDDDEIISSFLADLMNYFHILWEQHVYWTRMAIMGLVHDLPEKDLITQRLLRSPSDFAKILVHFYGEDAARTFESLFTDHLMIASQLVQDAMSGDMDAFTSTNQRWYENADKIAAFLASINPYWNAEDWEAMLHEHLDLIKQYASDMINQKYQESINLADEVEQQALEMADMMAEGIALQFPS